MLTRSDISLLAVRLFALYLIAQGLSGLPGLHVMLSNELYSPTERVAFSASIVGTAVIGAVVLVFSGALARKLMPAADAQSEPATSLSQIQTVVFATFGLILIVTTVPKLLGSIVTMMERDADDAGLVREYENSRMLTEVATIALAIVLCVGASYWTRLLTRFRDLGHEQTDSANS